MTGRGRWLRSYAIGLLVAALSGCSFVADYPDVVEETGNDLCHDGIDNDLDGEPECVDPGCEDFCPRAQDVGRPELDPCFNDGGFRFMPMSDRDDRLECVPFAASPDGCDDGILLPGGTECRAMTRSACDGSGPPSDAIHVRPGAMGGDGSVGAPYGSIAEAVAAAAPGDTVSLAEGRYEGPVVLERSLTLAGSCDGTSRIAAAGGAPALRIAADAAAVERLAVEAGGSGIMVDAAKDVRLRGIHVEGAAGTGLDIAGGAVEARDVVVDAVTGDEASGVRVRRGGTLRMTGGLVRASEGTGIHIADAQATLRAVGVVDSTADGVAIGQGGLATVAGAVVRRSGASLVSVDCREGSADCLTMSGSVLEGRRSGGGGMGIEVRSGGARVVKTRVSEATGQGVLVHRAAVTLIDVLVEGTNATDERTGIGVEVRDAGILDGERVELRANANRGLLVHGSGSRAQLRDLSVLADLELTNRGVGVEVRQGAALVLMGFYVFEAGSCGVAVRGEVTLSLTTGVIERGSAGVCISDAEHTVGELTSRVTYRGVGEPIAEE